MVVFSLPVREIGLPARVKDISASRSEFSLFEK
jgi:hypothetical protein